MPEQRDTGSVSRLPVLTGHEAKQEVGVITSADPVTLESYIWTD